MPHVVPPRFSKVARSKAFEQSAQWVEPEAEADVYEYVYADEDGEEEDQGGHRNRDRGWSWQQRQWQWQWQDPKLERNQKKEEQGQKAFADNYLPRYQHDCSDQKWRNRHAEAEAKNEKAFASVSADKNGGFNRSSDQKAPAWVDRQHPDPAKSQTNMNNQEPKAFADKNDRFNQSWEEEQEDWICTDRQREWSEWSGQYHTWLDRYVKTKIMEDLFTVPDRQRDWFSKLEANAFTDHHHDWSDHGWQNYDIQAERTKSNKPEAFADWSDHGWQNPHTESARTKKNEPEAFADYQSDQSVPSFDLPQGKHEPAKSLWQDRNHHVKEARWSEVPLSIEIGTNASLA